MTCSCGDGGFEPYASPEEVSAKKNSLRDVSDEERLSQLAQLWDTALGDQFHSYLTAEESPEEINKRAQHLTRMIFDQPELVPVRVSALQLMIEHLYATDRITEEIGKRILLIQGDIWQRHMIAEGGPQTSIAYQAVAAAVAALPFGSPLVRQSVRHFGQKLVRRLPFLKAVSRTKKPVSAVSTRDLFSAKFFKGYEFSKAVNTYIQVFGPYSLAYFFWMDWTEQAKAKIARDNVMLHDKVELVKSLSKYGAEDQ